MGVGLSWVQSDGWREFAAWELGPCAELEVRTGPAADLGQILQRPRRESYCGWRRRFINARDNDQMTAMERKVLTSAVAREPRYH